MNRYDYLSLSDTERSLLSTCIFAPQVSTRILGRLAFESDDFSLIDGELIVASDNTDLFKLSCNTIDLDLISDFEEQDVGTIEISLPSKEPARPSERTDLFGKICECQTYGKRLIGASRSLQVRHTLLLKFISGNVFAISAWPNFYISISSQKNIIEKWISSSANISMAEEIIGRPPPGQP